jgi:hypothetical protein
MGSINIKSEISNGVFRFARLDSMTHAAIGIDYSHHEIHAGDSFIYTDYDADVDIAGPKRYRITTPDTTKWAHLIIEATSAAAGVLAFSEDPTIDASGDAGTVYNLNRNSTTANTTLVKYDATTKAPNNDGTILWQDYIGNTGHPAATFGGSAYSRAEFILK